MRRLACLFVLCAACGSEQGAVLTFEAPDGMSATRIEVVLASADPEKISAVDSQRLRPGDYASDAVVYYRQRARGGVVDDVGALNGFSLRIEPELTEVADEALIPFVLAFDGDALIAVGSVAGVDGAPGAVNIVPDAVAMYTLVVVPVTTPSDANAGLAIAEGRVVTCYDEAQTAWRSGVAWQPPTGHQLRLLLPDLAVDASATDASERDPDLDCDAHAAWSGDCDDLRVAFHPGAAETCDGLDLDCDRRRLELIEGCPAPNQGTTCPASSTGVQLCVDAGITPAATACVADAACACEAGLSSCMRCGFAHQAGAGAGTALPCAPAVGKLHVSNILCDTCVLEVVGVKGPWKVTLSKLELGPFTKDLTGVPGYFYVRAETMQSAPFPGPLPASVGEVYLALSRSSTSPPELLSVELEILEDSPVTTCTTVVGGTDKAMYCTP